MIKAWGGKKRVLKHRQKKNTPEAQTPYNQTCSHSIGFPSGQEKDRCSGAPRADSVLGQKSSQYHPKAAGGRGRPRPHGAQSGGMQHKNRLPCLGFILLLQQLNVLQNHNLLASCLLLGEVVQIEPWQTTCKDFLPYLCLLTQG